MSKSLDLQVILAAKDRVTGPLKKINATTGATARALKQAQAETRKLQNTQRDISSYRKADKALKSNSAALSASQQRVRQLGDELKATAKPTAKLRAEYNKARKEVENFNDKGQKQRKELGSVRKRLKDAGISTRNLADEERKLAERMKVANSRMQRQKRYLEQLGKADVSGKFKNMTSEVGKFSKRALVATGGVAAGIFGLANSTATLGDEVAKTGDKIGIGLGPLQELRYAAERSGVSTQKFDSSLERFVKRMGEATSGTGAAKKAYDELGLSAEDLAKMTPEDSLAVVADRLGSVENQSQKVALAAQLFGREGVGMINMLKDGSAGLKELRKDALATGYVLSEKAARDAETFKDAMLDAQLGMTGMKNTIGAELMPAVTELMGDLSGWMRENKDQVKAFAATFGEKMKSALPVIRDLAVGVASTAKNVAWLASKAAGLVGGVENLSMVLAFLFALKPALAILAFGKALFAAGTALVGLAGGLPAIAAGVKAIGLALTANPIGIAIAAIAGAGYLIYKNWGSIASFFKGLWAQVKAAFSGGIAGVGKLILNWSPLGLFYKAFSGVMGWLGVDLPSNLTAAGGKMISGLVSGIGSAIGGLGSMLSGLWSGVSGAFSQGISTVGSLIVSWSPVSLFKKAFSGVMIWFGVDLPESFTGFGKQILDGLVGGILGGLSKVKETITGAGAKAIGWFKETLGIKSPSRVFMSAGHDTLEGYRQGLEQKEPDTLKQVTGFGKRVRQAGAGIAIGAAALPAAAGNVEFDSRPPISRGAPTTQQAGGDTITIHVNTAPGQSAQEIAGEVQRILAARDRAKATRARSALYDRD